MCGRFTLTQNEETLQQHYGPEAAPHPAPKRYNIAPAQNSPVLLLRDTTRALENMRWGLVPRWAKDDSGGSKLINARAETAAEKPSFRSAFKHRRCLVPADGFYEWKKHPGGRAKTPMRFTLRTGGIFSFAGLWESWPRPGEPDLLTFTIITTAANELLAPVHDRMPVILLGGDEQHWLTHGGPELLKPFPAELMHAYEVSTAVNSPSHDSEDCIKPASEYHSDFELS